MLKISASFDDGSKEDKYAASIMKQLGIPTIFYWPVGWKFYARANNRSYLTDDEAYDIAADHEIGSHTLFHPLLTRIPLDYAAAEIQQSRVALQERFDQPIDSFCYPRGYATPEIIELVKQAGYSNARSTLVGSTDEPADPFWTPVSVHIGCQRKEYQGLDWYDYALHKLEEATAKDEGRFSFFGHGWEITQNRDWHKFERLMNEVSNVYQPS